ncbi:MAG: hypothetical protein JKY23_04370 [Nitrospinaceae bacterium]|nr:hypothetical protein [Nitrospinaceae bacterium]
MRFSWYLYNSQACLAPPMAVLAWYSSGLFDFVPPVMDETSVLALERPFRESCLRVGIIRVEEAINAARLKLHQDRCRLQQIVAYLGPEWPQQLRTGTGEWDGGSLPAVDLARGMDWVRNPICAAHLWQAMDARLQGAYRLPPRVSPPPPRARSVPVMCAVPVHTLPLHAVDLGSLADQLAGARTWCIQRFSDHAPRPSSGSRKQVEDPDDRLYLSCADLSAEAPRGQRVKVARTRDALLVYMDKCARDLVRGSLSFIRRYLLVSPVVSVFEPGMSWPVAVERAYTTVVLRAMLHTCGATVTRGVKSNSFKKALRMLMASPAMPDPAIALIRQSLRAVYQLLPRDERKGQGAMVLRSFLEHTPAPLAASTPAVHNPTVRSHEPGRPPLMVQPFTGTQSRKRKQAPRPRPQPQPSCSEVAKRARSAAP